MTNRKAFTKLLEETRDYIDLSYLNMWSQYPLGYLRCQSAGHTEESGDVVVEENNPTGTDNLHVCHTCRLRWHVDSSD
jgi:hypothetical protein